jgi:hypothetical protein
MSSFQAKSHRNRGCFNHMHIWKLTHNGPTKPNLVLVRADNPESARLYATGAFGAAVAAVPGGDTPINLCRDPTQVSCEAATQDCGFPLEGPEGVVWSKP